MTALIITQPPIGITLKAVEIVSDLTGGPITLDELVNIANPKTIDLTTFPASHGPP